MRNRLLIYLGLTFALTYGICFWLMGAGGYAHPYTVYILMGIMAIPAVCSLIARILTREGFRGMWLRPNLRQGGWLCCIAAWFGIPLLIIAGAGAYFLLNPGQFDPSMAVYRQLTGMAGDMSDGQMMGSAVISLGVSALIAPVANALPCLGEELGWRGYLLPKLCDLMGEGPANLATGIIWGLWHAPMMAMGHNYGTDYPGFPWVGIGAMVVFCVMLGAILGRLSMVAGSVWPAVIGHGALNGLASAGVIFLAPSAAASPFIGPLPVGVIGGVGLILAGTFCLYQAFARPVYQTRNDIFIRY